MRGCVLRGHTAASTCMCTILAIALPACHDGCLHHTRGEQRMSNLLSDPRRFNIY